jgi:hypothetical protein
VPNNGSQREGGKFASDRRPTITLFVMIITDFLPGAQQITVPVAHWPPETRIDWD